MIVTTAGRNNACVIQTAKEISELYNLRYIDRNKESINNLREKYHSNVLMVGSGKIELHTQESVVKYHPNFAQVRMKRILKRQDDAFLEATNLIEGSTIIDCTMGMLSDSLIASFAVGKTGSVTSIEAVSELYITMVEGMKKYRYEIEELRDAAKRIMTYNMHSLDYLKQQYNDSVDVVYFDPMFEETIDASTGLQSMQRMADHTGLSNELIEEAKRVAKKRVVLKAHFRSPMFEAYGFMRCIRPSSTSHFGVIIK